MRTNVWASVGGISPPKCLLFLLLLTLVISPALAGVGTTLDPSDSVYINTTYKLSNDTSTPFSMWAGAILLGVFLVLLSFMSGFFPNGEEGLVSILAWIPIAFALFASFAVDRITSAGLGSIGGTTNKFVLLESHTVYHFDVVAVCLVLLLAFAIGNSWRIWISQKKLRQLTETEM